MSRLFTFLIILTAFAVSGFAQGFGKNKVQYVDFDWRYIQSEHFDVYYSAGQERIAEFTAETAERALSLIEASWDYTLEGRVRFIIYASHNRFQQTNVSLQIQDEALGGFTEFLKNRVVLPFTGNYESFRHVIHHELSHAVNLRMFYGTGFQSILIGVATSDIPLWFTEGLAEYESRGGWDVEADMFMRDATISGYLPPIDYLGGYFAYKGGQSVFYYIDRRYGKEKVGELVNKVKSSREVPRSLKSATGLKMEEFNRAWQNWLRKLYWPGVANYESPEDFAERVTNHRELRNFVNNGGSISPDGLRIAYLSDQSDYFDIWMKDLETGRAHRLLQGERSGDFEQLKWLDARISWSPDGESITFASKAGAYDAINILNVNKRDVVKRFRPKLEGVFNPVFSPDGSKIAFVGLKSGESDLYYYEIESGKLVQVTNDVFSDDDPAWSADGKMLYFSSDRKDSLRVSGYDPSFNMWEFDYRSMNIYRISIGDDSCEQLTTGEYTEKLPTLSPDGKNMIFVSDESGISNLYRMDLETMETVAITNALTGCFQPSYSALSNRLVFTSFFEGGYDLYLLKAPDKMEAKTPVLTAFRQHGTPEAVEPEVGEQAETSATSLEFREDTREYSRYVFADGIGEVSEHNERAMADTVNTRKPGGGFFSKKYRVKFTPDYVYATAAYSSFFGAQGTGQILFSDLMGNQLIVLNTDLYYDFNNLDNSNFSLQYYYLPHRINYGAGLYRYVYYLDAGNVRDQTMQLQFDLSYPFSKYTRAELIVGGYGIDRADWQPDQYGYYDYRKIARRRILLPELGYVHDTVVWGSTGPVNGTRYRVSTSYSPNLQSDRKNNEIWSSEFYTAKGDLRQYFRLGRDYSWASRLTAGLSGGPEPQRFFMGGVSNWINRRFENNEIPTDEINDFYFSSFVTPFRGGDYFEKRGTGNRYFLTNQEFRFPLVRYLQMGWPLPLALADVRGALFTDVGAAWFNDSFRLTSVGEDGNRRLHDLQAAYGFGWRSNLGFLLLRWDVAWSTDGVDTSKPRYYFSLGAEY
ncbi:MAG: PD40 domain-containing protein [Calditrichaeota bacterium]|nr:PD40 domain-containing protein [Calditrichota bacterium]MCB9368493.1 PD40 domain-containing protein [Calditrichota bacterium]